MRVEIQRVIDAASTSTLANNSSEPAASQSTSTGGSTDGSTSTSTVER